MLAIPLKKSASADIATPLLTHLTKAYGESKANQYLESFSALRHQRDKFLNLASKKTVSEGDIHVVTSYLRTLAIIDNKFPNEDEQLGLRFQWFDSFQLNKNFVYTKTSAERACVLFNFAALHSKIAINLDRSSDAATDKACDFFRTAGSIFLYLRNEYLPRHNFGAVTADLSPAGLSMLSNMMLAQAQVCIFERGMKTNKSSSVMAKLAQGSYDLYKKAYYLTVDKSLQTVLSASWGSHLSFQAYSYKASAMNHTAKVVFEEAEKNAEGYGKHVAWLQNCKDTCQQALAHATQRNLPSRVTSAIQELNVKVNNRLEVAIKENNTIYLEPVPDFKTLPVVEGKILVKVHFERILSHWRGDMNISEEVEGDVFFGLLPQSIERALHVFEQKISEMRVSIEKTVNDGIESTRNMLTDANLPMVIEAGEKSVDGLPDETYARIIAVVHAENGIDGLKDQLEKNAERNKEMKGIATNCLERLIDNDQKDSQRKVRFGDKWTIPGSSDTTAPMRKECLKHLGYLSEGAKNDAALLAQLQDPVLGKMLADVSLPKEALDRLMPSDEAIDDDETVESFRSKLRFSYIALDEKLAATSRELQQLKSDFERGTNAFAEEMMKRQDINSLVNDPNELNEVIEISLTQYIDEISNVSAAVEEFTPLLGRVIRDSVEYAQSRQNNEVTQRRVEALKRIEEGITQFTNFQKNVSEGKKFYGNLIVKVEKLKILVDDHLLSRELVSDELEAALIEHESSNNNPNQGHLANINRQQSQPLLAPIQHQQPPPQQQQQQPPPQGMYGAVDPNGFPIMPMPHQPYGYHPMGGAYPYPMPHQQPHPGYNPYPYGYPPQQQAPYPHPQQQQPHTGYPGQQPPQGGQGTQPNQGNGAAPTGWFNTMMKSRRKF